MKEFCDIIGYTISNFGKEKNGDNFLFEQLEEEGILIAVVADGVSQQPCDWFASSTTCQSLIGHFKKNSHQTNIQKRLSESILQTNREVASTEGKCHKMASTLSVVVFQKSSAEINYANIGDSRIYSLHNGKLDQLTTDNVIVRKERVLTAAGIRVIDKPVLTKVIGQDNLTFEITTKSIQTGEVLLLATDGFYDARKVVFNKLMIEFGEAKDFEAGFAKLIGQMEILRGDDLTAIAIKRLAN